MKNNRGQALVEFILVFPLIIFLIVGMIDFGNILYQKYQLENELDYVSDLYLAEKENEMNTYASQKKITLNYQKTGNNVRITLAKKVKLSTPGLTSVLGNPYTIFVERVFYEE